MERSGSIPLIVIFLSLRVARGAAHVPASEDRASQVDSLPETPERRRCQA